jgi:hypothetical protein
MNLAEFRLAAQRRLKEEDFRKYLQSFPTIPIDKRESFFSLLTTHPIERAVVITGGDLPPYLGYKNLKAA